MDAHRQAALTSSLVASARYISIVERNMVIFHTAAMALNRRHFIYR